MPPKIKVNHARFESPWPIATKDIIYDRDNLPTGTKANSKKVCLPIPISVHHFFADQVRPRHSTIKNLILILLKKMQDECLAKGITDITKQEEFERFVANCRVVEGER